MCLACSEITNDYQLEENAFGDKMLEVLNHGALSLMLSLGHRSGLFDIMSVMPAATSEGIAREAGLSERYVREWLGAMVVGGIVEYDEASGMFSLPQEHASFLTREAAANNLATLMQFVPLLGTVEDRILQCFQQGGGVPYSAYPRFQEVMADDSGQSVLPELLSGILPLMPGMKQRLEEGIDVLDVGCGRGRALTLLARNFPNSRFLGLDFSEEAVRWAEIEAAANRLNNIRFVIGDAAELGREEAFDLILTFDAIHDQAKPLAVLKNIRRSLRDGGTYMMQDIDASSEVDKNIGHPIGTLLYTVSCMHCMTVSLAQGGAGLGAVWGRELAEQMLKEAGFGSIRTERLSHDVQNCYYIVQKEH